MTSHSPGATERDDLESLAARARSGLFALQELQRRYDADMWDISEPAFANARHVLIHLTVTVGKIAKLIEPADHDAYHGRPLPDLSPEELSPILADLLMHTAQLANIVDAALSDALSQRYRNNAARFAPDSELRSI